MSLAGSFKPRSIRFLGQWRIESWRLKIYGITFGGEIPDAGLTRAARDCLSHKIEAWAGDMGGYGVGYVGIHDGRDYDVVFLDWWVNENELRHEMFISPKGGETDLKPAPEKAPKVCVWDLYLQAFERQAWVETAMVTGDLDAYLARKCNASA